MKVLIVSDTHGINDILEYVIEKEKPFDLLLHLGDSEGLDHYIREFTDRPVEMVKGNNDYFSNMPPLRVFDLGKHTIFMTHGHNYYVYSHTNALKKKADEFGADIIIYGHTHVPKAEIDGKYTILNPGSLAYPRQSGHIPSYMVMDIDDEGELTYTIKYIDKK